MHATHTGHAWGNGPRHYEIFDAVTHDLVHRFTHNGVKSRDRHHDRNAFHREGWEIVGVRNDDGTWNLRRTTTPEEPTP